jgi:23S rRNA (adenine2503-C2)-methyltransferase
MSSVPLIYDFTQQDLAQILGSWGEPAYRARQLYHALYHELIDNPLEMTALPGGLRSRLLDNFRFEAIKPVSEMESSDHSTRKILFTLDGGQAIEVVLMRYARRITACISTQAGCGMGCVFCATGQMGLLRNLSPGEIVAQVLFYARLLKAEGKILTNVVIMGMGEPFHNYQATLKAVDTLGDPEGFNLGARRITISTVGLVPMIDRFAAEKRQVNLAVSLHAATNELRDRLVPINRRYPLELLLPACRNYVKLTGRRISFEWALISGVNDDPHQAGALVRLIQGLTCHVNVIPLNPTSGFDGEASDSSQADRFVKVLASAGIPCTLRTRRGIDIQAGCGQLAVETDSRRLSG